MRSCWRDAASRTTSVSVRGRPRHCRRFDPDGGDRGVVAADVGGLASPLAQARQLRSADPTRGASRPIRSRRAASTRRWDRHCRSRRSPAATGRARPRPGSRAERATRSASSCADRLGDLTRPSRRVRPAGSPDRRPPTAMMSPSPTRTTVIASRGDPAQRGGGAVCHARAFGPGRGHRRRAASAARSSSTRWRQPAMSAWASASDPTTSPGRVAAVATTNSAPVRLRTQRRSLCPSAIATVARTDPPSDFAPPDRVVAAALTLPMVGADFSRRRDLDPVDSDRAGERAVTKSVTASRRCRRANRTGRRHPEPQSTSRSRERSAPPPSKPTGSPR